MALAGTCPRLGRQPQHGILSPALRVCPSGVRGLWELPSPPSLGLILEGAPPWDSYRAGTGSRGLRPGLAGNSPFSLHRPRQAAPSPRLCGRWGGPPAGNGTQTDPRLLLSPHPALLPANSLTPLPVPTVTLGQLYPHACLCAPHTAPQHHADPAKTLCPISTSPNP